MSASWDGTIKFYIWVVFTPPPPPLPLLWPPREDLLYLGDSRDHVRSLMNATALVQAFILLYRPSYCTYVFGSLDVCAVCYHK